MMARWIRLPLPEFESSCVRLAMAQTASAAPILAWAEGDARHLFALIAPLKHAPGRRQRWFAWGAVAAAATYRQFGLPAYIEGEALWLHGRKIADGSALAVGECALISSSFPAPRLAIEPRALEQAFRLRLEAQLGWQFDTSWPTEAETLHYALA